MPQDLPTTSPKSQSVFRALISDIEAREAKGIETYGRSLETHNGRSALLDLYEELLDAAAYTKQLLMEQADRTKAPAPPPVRQPDKYTP